MLKMSRGNQRNFALSSLQFYLIIQIFFFVGIKAAPTATTNMKISSTPYDRNREGANIDNESSNTTANSISSNTKLYLKWTLRSAWHAATPLRNPTRIPLAGGVSHVIIHHTATPAVACQQHNTNSCAATVRAIQRTHQEGRGWDDIGYNFLIGGNDELAEIYEGRGFNVVGAHAVGYNARSVGIALIGDWTDILPPRPVLNKLQQLILYGVNMGHIQRNYILLGHRQVKATECPGTRLYNELKEWPHYEQRTTTNLKR